MEKANQAKELFNDFFSDIKSMKQELTHKVQHQRQSPKKKQNKMDDLDKGDYEYYDEELD